MKLSFLSWVAGLLGFALLVYGVAMISAPAACIVAGVALMAWSFLADRASAALKAKSKPQGG
jgi:hypothetical protein